MRHDSPGYERLREVLIDARKQSGLTQKEVADRLGRPQSFVSKYELGERRIDVVEFLAVCGALGADPHQLLSQTQRTV